MPGDFVRRVPQWSMEMFHAFYNERPKEEKWELIDGVPIMMPPPTLVHQRICRNLGVMLNLHLARVKPQWQADHKIGVLQPGDERFNPEPDVTVIDADVQLGQIYAERFYFVAEVLSNSDRPETLAGSDKPIVLAAKLAYYRAHAHCRSILIVRQDRIEADLHARANTWSTVTLKSPSDPITVPEIGAIGMLGDLYRHTPLWSSVG